MNKISFYFSNEFNNSRSQIYLLIDKILQQNEDKIFLYCEPEFKDIIDKEIWTFSQQKFIPHLPYVEISSIFEINNTNLIIFNEFIVPKEDMNPNFLIFINPSEKYINFIKKFTEKKEKLNILVFFFKEYKDEDLDEVSSKYESKIFSITTDKTWKEIKK